MESSEIKQQIIENAAEVTKLHRRIHETLATRGPEWHEACAEFHARYDLLAFPGGYCGALERIAAGDVFTMEAALCFLEVRPYFFRSGYMFDELLRRSKRAALSSDQRDRLHAVLQRLHEWKSTKAPKNKAACVSGRLRKG